VTWSVTFKNQADRLDNEKESILDNRPDRGDVREDAVLDFLRRHLPNRCTGIKGGLIFDHLGNRSSQIDIIITSDSTLQFRSSLSNTFGKSFTCIEGCYAAISIKTKLTKNALIDSLNNLSSIPLLKNIKPSPIVDNFDKFIKQVPLKVIFAFDGDSVDNIKTHMEEYLNNNNLSPEKLPDFIIVNKKYYIWKVGPDGQKDLLNQIVFDYGSYVFEYNYAGVGALALLHLLAHIQKISNLSIVSIINFNEYVDGAEIYLKNPSSII
jgi:hypothetical protein